MYNLEYGEPVTNIELPIPPIIDCVGKHNYL